MRLLVLIGLFVPFAAFSAKNRYPGKITFLNGRVVECLTETPASNTDGEIGYQLDETEPYQVISSDSLMRIEVRTSVMADPVVFEYCLFGVVKKNSTLDLKTKKEWLLIWSEWKSLVVYASSLNYIDGGLTNGILYYARKTKSPDVYLLGNASDGGPNGKYFKLMTAVFMEDAPELVEKIKKREYLPHQVTEIMDLYQTFLEHGKLSY